MNLGIIFGGSSYEHEISIISAIALKQVLKEELKFIFCDMDRNFYLIKSKDLKASYFASGEYKNSDKLEISKGGFFRKKLFKSEKVEIDVCINLIHGADGEDGKIPALFEFFDISYIGPNIEASVMSYSKELTKYLAKIVGVKTLDFEVIKRGENINMSYPFIIKPNSLGSSIGVEIIKDKKELEYGLDKAFEYDKKLLVEPFIKDVKEYNLAGTKIKDEIIFSKIEEVQKKDFLDFDQKYLKEKVIKEANLSDELKDKLKDAFTRIYNFGFDNALIRCDFFIVDNEVYLNEINPNPGSLANYLFCDFNDLITKLAKNLVKKKKIKISYETLNSITSNK